MNSETSQSLLLILPMTAFSEDGAIYIDAQAINGLRQWLRHFDRLTLGVKLISGARPDPSCEVLDQLEFGGRVELFLMPPAWTPLSFLRSYPTMHKRLAQLIDSHRYLQFALGGAWGDWGAVGALIAARRGRKAVVWTDRVESEVMRFDALRYRGLRKWTRWANSRLAKQLERRAIRRSALGLFHGSDTYEAYSRFSQRPYLVHDIHLKPEDRIPFAQLEKKIAGAKSATLEIIYVGRVHPDKGVMDWIEVLTLLAATGATFRARWFGNGPQLDEARSKVVARGLSEIVMFPGYIDNRERLLEALRSAHLMLFCHLTPESPRNLIEALVSGTPIVGYRSAYTEDLIARNSGGLLTPKEPTILANRLSALDRDRTELAALINLAALDGNGMNDDSVFTHRSDLIKRFS